MNPSIVMQYSMEIFKSYRNEQHLAEDTYADWAE
jgi:hypothetical protein